MSTPEVHAGRKRNLLRSFIVGVAVVLLMGIAANEWFARWSYQATQRTLQECVGKTDPAHNLTTTPGLVRGFAGREVSPSARTQIVQLSWWSLIGNYRVHVLTSSDGEILALSTNGNHQLLPIQTDLEAGRHPGNRSDTSQGGVPQAATGAGVSRLTIVEPSPDAAPPPALHSYDKRRPSGGTADRSVVQLECYSLADSRQSSLLVRELYRQALLIAARDELHLATRDRVLREALDSEAVNSDRPLNLVVEPVDTGLRIRAVRWDGKQDVVVKEWTAPLPTERQIAQVTQAAEDWSRGEFVEFLKANGFKAAGNPERGTAEVPAFAQEQAAKYNVVSQYAAIRHLHREIAEKGESPELLAALSRSYALLGSLGDYFWSTSPKAFRARGLLYAERLLQQNPQSAAALRNRAYVRALAGLPADALADLGAATTASPDEPLDPASRAVRAYCLGDLAGLKSVPDDDPASLLARYLWMRCIDDLGTEEERIVAAGRMLDLAPDCTRALEVVAAQASLGTSRKIVGVQDGWFASSLYPLVADARVLPESDFEVTTEDDDNDPEGDKEISRRVALLKALMAAGGAERDRQEPSLGVLASLIQDVSFVQSRERMVLMGDQLAINDDQTLDRIKPLLQGHPFARFLESYRQKHEGDKMLRGDPMAEILLAIPFVEFDSFSHTLVGRLGYEPEQARMVAEEIQQHRDQMHSDLKSALIDDEHVPKSLCAALTAQFQRVSPHAPPVIVARIRHAWNEAEPHAGEWEQNYHDNVAILRALAKRYSELHRSEDAERCQKRVIELHPNQIEYRRLASIYRERGDMDLWQSTLEKSLNATSFGLEDAATCRDIAYHLMRQDHWKEALPFALRSAESYSGWGMACAADCYEGLGNWSAAEKLHTKMYERYEDGFTWYLWCRCTGHGDLQAARAATAEYIEKCKHWQIEKFQLHGGLYHDLEGNPKEAQKRYATAFRITPNPYTGMLAFLGADQIGNKVALQQLQTRLLRASRARSGYLLALSLAIQGALAHPQPDDLNAARVEWYSMQSLRDGSVTDAQYFIGRFLLNRGREAEGLEILKLAASSPVRDSTTRMLACAELQRRKIDIPRMRGSECAEPMRDAIRLIGQGNAALERGDLDVAAALYAEAAASKPDCALAWERTARLAVNRNRPEEADRALGELAKLLGDEPRFLALRAEIEQDFGQYRPAVADLEKALARSPHQPLAESQLATLFAACPDESIRNGKRAVELAEDLASRADVPYAEAYSVLASAYAEVGQFPDAIRFGEAALRHSSGKERASLEEQLKNFREQHPWRMKPEHAAGDSIPPRTVE